MYDINFSIEYDDDPTSFGNLQDNFIQNITGINLYDALIALFHLHEARILIAVGKSYTVMSHYGKFYFPDSHSCDPKAEMQCLCQGLGRAGVIECDTLAELHHICK